MSKVADRIAENYQRVLERVSQAAHRSGRSSEDVTVVAVTKYVDAEWVVPLIEAGCRDFGESRPQELWKKSAALDADVRWHLIGHLQRTRSRKTIPLVEWIHSVDSHRLLTAADEAARNSDCRPKICLEVNISGDESKHGWSPEEMEQVASKLDDYPHLDICGLMGMSALGSDDRAARQQFVELQRLKQRLQQHGAGSRLQHLSMGMSGDFEVAIEEGATLIRIGSLLFSGCNPP